MKELQDGETDTINGKQVTFNIVKDNEAISHCDLCLLKDESLEVCNIVKCYPSERTDGKYGYLTEKI